MEEVYETERQARKEARKLAVRTFFEAVKWAAITFEGDQVVGIALSSKRPKDEAWPFVRNGKAWLTEFKDVSNDIASKKLIAKHMYTTDDNFFGFYEDERLMRLYEIAVGYLDR